VKQAVGAKPDPYPTVPGGRPLGILMRFGTEATCFPLQVPDEGESA